MCQIKIINLINIILFLKYDDMKLKCNYSMYVYCTLKTSVLLLHVNHDSNFLGI